MSATTLAPAVRYELAAGVARITLDDGKLNVMSEALLGSLSEAFRRATADEAVVLFRSGRAGVFSAGFDLKVFAAGDVAGSQAMVKAGAELALQVLTHPTPVVTVCEGHAYPMGAFLILASDIRIAAEGAWKIGFNETAIGIPVPSFALEIGRQRLAPAYLSRTAVTGEIFGPAEACAAGFFDRVVSPTDLEATIAGVLAAVGQVHRASHSLTKKRLRAGAAAAIRAAIDAELTVAAYQGTMGGRSAVKLPG